MSSQEIQGLKELTAQLKKLNGMNPSKVMKKGGNALLKYSRINAPVKTGALRANSGVADVEGGVEMRFNQQYSYFQEHGYENGSYKGKHYVQRAIDEHADDVVKEVQKSIEDEIKKLL